MATTELGRPRARLELPGSGSGPATLEVIYQPKATRLTRVVLILLVTAALVPFSFFIPPHFLWPLVVLAVGIFLAHRLWVGEFYVSTFDGACPRCGTKVELKPGSRIKNHQMLQCFGCHRQPELVMESAEETARKEGFERPAPDVERRRKDVDRRTDQEMENRREDGDRRTVTPRSTDRPADAEAPEARAAKARSPAPDA